MSEYGIDADELAIALGIAEEFAEERGQFNNNLDENEDKLSSLSDDAEFSRRSHDNAPAGSFEEYVQVAINTPKYFKRHKDIKNSPLYLLYNVRCLDIQFLEIFYDVLSGHENKRSEYPITELSKICRYFIKKGFADNIALNRSLLQNIIDDLSKEDIKERPVHITLYTGYSGFKFTMLFKNMHRGVNIRIEQ
jgi:hypothetical protein